MRRLLILTLPLLSAVWLAQASAREGQGKPAATCNGEFGTAVHFEKSPSDAAKRALKEEKLVCVLHISGHFEDRDFT